MDQTDKDIYATEHYSPAEIKKLVNPGMTLSE